MNNIINLVAYFIIYSFLGWILESITKSIIEKKIVNSGFLNGPICPIYGIGAIIMDLFLSRFSDNYFLLFAMAFVILSVWEYLVGVLLEKIYNTKYWDYTNCKFNIQGRVCLANSLCWGVLGLVFILFIHPFVSTNLMKIPTNLILSIEIVAIIYIVIDFVISSIKIKDINLKLITLTEISDKIREKLDELKIQEKAEKIKAEKINKVIAELKQKQNEIKETLDKQTKRLRKAFPTMKSLKINQFLTQTIEKIKNDKK